MSDIRIEPPTPVSGAAAVQAVRPPDRSGVAPSYQPPAPQLSTVAASTGGRLRPAYAQFLVDPDTHDVVVRVRDTVTGALLDETPSKEIQQMHRSLRDYAQTMARRKAALGTAN